MNKNLLIFSICLVVLTISMGLGALQFTSPSFLKLILIALSVATWLVYFFMERANTENFIRNYLLTIVIKLLAGGIFIFTIIYADMDGAESNAITFMAAYLLFTVLEVGFLFKKFNQG
jgi:hypothetical protein